MKSVKPLCYLPARRLEENMASADLAAIDLEALSDLEGEAFEEAADRIADGMAQRIAADTSRAGDCLALTLVGENSACQRFIPLDRPGASRETAGMPIATLTWEDIKQAALCELGELPLAAALNARRATLDSADDDRNWLVTHLASPLGQPPMAFPPFLIRTAPLSDAEVMEKVEATGWDLVAAEANTITAVSWTLYQVHRETGPCVIRTSCGSRRVGDFRCTDARVVAQDPEGDADLELVFADELTMLRRVWGGELDPPPILTGDLSVLGDMDILIALGRALGV
jgi:hypothetical protein